MDPGNELMLTCVFRITRQFRFQYECPVSEWIPCMSDTPAPVEPDARFRAALVEGKLELQRCSQCWIRQWPAVLHCPVCGSWDQEWLPVAIEGTVFTWTRTHHDFPGTEGLVKPFVTVVVNVNNTPLQLMGLLEGPQEGITIGVQLAGRIVVQSHINKGNPAFRWWITQPLTL